MENPLGDSVASARIWCGTGTFNRFEHLLDLVVGLVAQEHGDRLPEVDRVFDADRGVGVVLAISLVDSSSVPLPDPSASWDRSTEAAAVKLPVESTSRVTGILGAPGTAVSVSLRQRRR